MVMKLCLVDACCFVLTSEVVQQMSQIQLFKGCVKSWIPICDMFSCLWPPYGIKPPSSYACRSWKIECWFGADAITCDSRLSQTEKESGRYVKISDKRSANIYIYIMSYIWKNLYEDIKKYVSFVFKRTLPQCSRHLEQHFWNSERLVIDAIGYWARRCLQSSLAASIQARFIQTSEL